MALSSNGQIVAIGSPYNDGNGTDAGHVRVYQFSNGAWSQLGNDIDGEAAGDFSGYAISLSSDGTILAIGAIYNNGNGASAGHVRVYEYTSGNWVKIGSDIDGEASNDNFGMSVQLSGDGTMLAVGAGKNDNNGTNAGHVRIFKYINGVWVPVGADIDGEAGGDEFGYSIHLSRDGTTLSVGAPYNDGNGSNSGHVRVFDNLTTTGL